MIKSLEIKNYVLIKDLHTDFCEGLNIITGETGAGKSVLLGALGLLLGTRTDTASIGTASGRASVTGVFEIAYDGEGARLLRAEGIEELNSSEDRCEIEIRREITSSGRSAAFVNDAKISIALLKRLGQHLVDIHSQHQTLLLAEPAYQLYLLDRLAANEELSQRYLQAYSHYRQALDEYATLKKEIDATLADRDYLLYQFKEIAALDLDADEDGHLEERIETLRAEHEFNSALGQAMMRLNGAEVNAYDLIEEALTNLQSVETSSPETLVPLIRQLEKAREAVDDASNRVRDMVTQSEVDADMLERTEERYSALTGLLAKHGLDSVEALIDYCAGLKRRLDHAGNASGMLAEKEAAARQAKKGAVMLARELTARRKEAARRLEKLLIDNARPLGMNNLHCEIAFESGKLTPTGMDEVDFLFSFNKNQALMPLRCGASGGEMSRLMLAVKSVLASVVELPTMVFDEIDTGVSGEVASKMADMMKATSVRGQLIVITHLPQVAARGERHFKVYKHDSDTETVTRIESLGNEERVREIAVMLGGHNPSPEAIATARQFLNTSGNNDPDKKI